MMIKVSAILGTSVVSVLLVSFLGLNQNEIKGSPSIDPKTTSDLLEDCPNGEFEDCMAFFGNMDKEVLEVKDIKVLEEDDDIDLGFEAKNYLPKDFNPYSTLGGFHKSSENDDALTPVLDGTANLGTLIQMGNHKPLKVDDIVVLENDDVIDLGFNVQDYLPRDFNPYASK